MRKNWLWYQTFRFPVVKSGLSFFYKRIIVRGRKNIPKNKPILFLCNHQNSFMDALLVATNTTKYMYFLTRAQAFKPAIQGAFIKSLNMVPVYRARDGLSSVTKNKEIFDECIDYLKRNETILIFPEANHDLKRRVRPLSKGFTRIAFDAEIRENWDMDLHLVPAGVNYGEHLRSRNYVRVEYGEPIRMKEFEKLYKKDEHEATNALKKRVHEALEKLTMHVPNLDHYPLNHIILDDLEPDQRKLIDPDLVNSRVKMIEQNADQELYELAKELKNTAKEEGISIKYFTRKAGWAKKILLSPIYLFSWINNIIPYQPVRYLIKNVIKDHAHDSSIKFLVSMFLFPLFWILVSMIFYLSGIPGTWIAGYLLISIFTVTQFKDANSVIRIMKERKELKDFKESKPELFNKLQTGINRLNEFRLELLDLSK